MPRTRSGTPTLRTIAAELGVTHVTVSLALRDDPRISPTTREQVKEVANRLGYRPDPELQRLMHYLREKRGPGFHGVLVYLNFSTPRYDAFRGSYLLGMLAGARQRANQLGYNLEEFWCGEPGLTPQRAAQILEARGIRGVLIPPLQVGLPAPDFALDRFATALLTYSFAGELPGLNRVVPNQQDDMRRLYAHLASAGYKRIGLVCSRDIHDRMHSAPLAHLLALPYTHPGVRALKPFLYADEAEFRKIPGWFDAVKPDVLVVPHAWEFRQRCNAMGWTGYRSVTNAAYGGFSEDLLCLHQDPARIGAAGVDLVAAAIQRNEIGKPANPKIVQIDGEIVAPKTRPLWEIHASGEIGKARTRKARKPSARVR